jgi:hypothetical protein
MITPGMLVALILIVLLLEVILFWAAAALGNAPDLGWGKLALVSFAATVACVVVGGLIGWSLQSVSSASSVSLLAPENRLFAGVVVLLGILVTWVIPGMVYAPLVPVSVPRGMLISVVQVLLRIFLYTLIGAIVMVVLAVMQIWRGADVRVEVWAPAVWSIFT